MEKPSVFERVNNWARRSVTLKLLSIGFLILILLIPTSMLTSLIYERQGLRDGAICEVSSKWGDQQVIGGPVLNIPYTEIVKNDKGELESVTRYAHFLPDELNITGSVTPEKRYRGIYVVVLYNSKLHITGKFSYPNYQALEIPEGDLKFNHAYISLGIPDMKGINDDIKFKWNDSTYSFNPGLPEQDLFTSGASFDLDLTGKAVYNFSFDLNLNGSTCLRFLPFGKETNVTLQSDWVSPSFMGSFLPAEHEMSDKGFTAKWKVLQLNRNYPQQGVGSFIGGSAERLRTDNGMADYDNSDDSYSSFGVKLLLPIDEYQKIMRSVKYCTMFIIITFLAFFFTEVLNKRRIHPIQYLLVGFGICLFYVLLLSISGTSEVRFFLPYLMS